MPVLYIQPYQVTGQSPVSGRVFRLIALAAQRAEGQIGVYEFEMYDAQGRNLCRNADTMPIATASPYSGVGTNYPPLKAIDGNYSSWPNTCYMDARSDGESYLEFTFPVDVNPTSWRMMPEGTWLPANPVGVRLEVYRNGSWIDITGTVSGIRWNTNTWRGFTIPTVV